MTLPLPKEELEKIEQELSAAVDEFVAARKEIRKEEDALEADLVEAAEKARQEALMKKLDE